MIEIENPNRAAQKSKKTTEALDVEKAPELSRREREEIQKQKARAHYEKMHAAGRTDQVSFAKLIPFPWIESKYIHFQRRARLDYQFFSVNSIVLKHLSLLIRHARI